tara:strand:- start:3722 stop:4795 length:1074 start_codon:yes stop_codon:yes gene_type:complete
MIKCFEPSLKQEDISAAVQALNEKVLAFGPNVLNFENSYKQFSKKKYNIGFNSASSAAYLLYQYLYERYGQCRVYTTSLGFVSPVFAALKNGHEVHYVDVDDNLLMCHESLSKSLIEDSKLSIVMPVLYGGVSSISNLEEVCKEKNCLLVLDSAHCISPTINYDYAFYSFHPVKPICMSNGGLLATNDREASNYMFLGRNFGRKQQEDSYDLVQSGFNFYMNNLNASLGLSQINKCLENVAARKNNFNFLKNNIPSSLGRFTCHDERSSYYLSTLVLKKEYYSDIMRKELYSRGVQTSFHYPFLHKSSFYKQDVNLPVLESMQNKIINLPIHQELCQNDLEKIVNECIRHSRSRRQP